MADVKKELAFTFMNPNTPKIIEQQLRKLCLDKLLILYTERQRTAD